MKIPALLLTLLLGACSILPGTDKPSPPAVDAEIAVPPAPTSRPATTARRGGYYLDDGPGDAPPPDLARIPDAIPRDEPLHRFANKPYNVFGRDYLPLAGNASYKMRGIASWYGRKFHGQKTSSGEIYDMYGMTAAHPTLPIPSYVRVSNPANGRSVVLRVNDRGPFHADRLIDLSYTAAWKLGYVDKGSALVDVERIVGYAAAAPQPSSPTPTPTARPVVPTRILTQRDSEGTWLQLGAFSSLENAESFLAHLARELANESDPADSGIRLDSKLKVRSAGSWHRVQLGPWRDAVTAKSVADSLQGLVGAPRSL